MRSYTKTRCTRCGHEEVRYVNVKRCRACGGPIERPAPADAAAARLELAERIVDRAWLWASHDAELWELLRKWKVE